MIFHHARQGFTLIELLVVLTIVALLAAILFPVFAKAREKARQTAWLSNSHQIGLALTQYVQDYDEKYPQEHPSTSNPVVDDSAGQLETIDYGAPFDKIQSYVSPSDDGEENLYVCPSDPDPRGRTILDNAGSCKDSGEEPPSELTSYVVNAYYLFGAAVAQIALPAQSIYVSERNDAFCDVHYHPWLAGEADAPDAAHPDWPSAIAARRHTDGANYVYADGHSKWRRLETTRAPFPAHPLFGEQQAF